ncbi:MAG: hypothetical protein U0R26_11240 [Solirubrobacterales bacterium]
MPAEVAATNGVPAAPVVATVEAVAEERRVLENDEARAEFTNRGGALVSFRLKRFAERGQPVELVRARAEGALPLAVVGADGGALGISTALHQVTEGVDAAGRPSLTFEYRGPEGAEPARPWRSRLAAP